MTPRPRALLSAGCSMTAPEDAVVEDEEDFCLASVGFELEPLRPAPREKAIGIDENELELFCTGES